MANYMNNMKSNKEAKMMNKVNKGQVTLEQLLALDKAGTKIDMNECENKIQLMQLIYEPNSEVGACTVIAGNMYTVILETEDDLDKFKNKINMLKSNKTHKAYGESVWVEGYNMFKQFNFTTGHYYVYYVVTNAEMKALEDKIKAMDKDSMTMEDAKALQADLPPFVRAWQESSIDVTKDKDKKFKYSYKDFFSMLNVVSTYNKKHANEITNNFAMIKKDASIAFEISLPSDKNDEVCKDMLGLVNKEIKAAAEDEFNDNFIFMYNIATMDRYDKYVDYARENRELAFFINSIFDICKASLNSDVKLTKAQYEAMRNVIYTKALDLCIDKHEVINVAMSVAMSRIYVDKDGEIVVKAADKDSFRAFPVKDIFAKEFYEAVTDKTYTEELTVDHIIEMTRDIEDNEEIEFVNGESTDGAIVLDIEFNGIVKEIDGKLIYEVDAYAFELTTGLLVNQTYAKDATPKAPKFDNGAFFESTTKNMDTAIIRGKNNNIITSRQNLLGRFIASQPVQGTVAIDQIISFVKPGSKQQQLFLIVLA